MLLEEFFREHSILIEVNNIASNSSNNEDEEMLEEPTLGDDRVARINCYEGLFEKIRSRQACVIQLPLDELIDWDAIRGRDLAVKITNNALRYQQHILPAILDQHFLRPTAPPTSSTTASSTTEQERVQHWLDVLQQQRFQEATRNSSTNNNNDNNEQPEGGLASEMQSQNRQLGVTQDFPPQLMRRYELHILPLGRNGSLYPFNLQKRSSTNDNLPQGKTLRHVRSESLGRLVTIQGMMVRMSDVKPICLVATYTCDACGVELYQVISGKSEFLPQKICVSCGSNMIKMETRLSHFTKYQEYRLQELPHQVPMGHVPRSLSVICKGEITRTCSPGDICTIDGIFLPQKTSSSYYNASSGLMTTTFLEAMHIHIEKQQYHILQDKREDDIENLSKSDNVLQKLSRGIAPEIYGHEDLKKALLLQLVGGSTRVLPDGMRIRGDLNICIMGDPGVAKSQLLKFISTMTPRGVYTTGKGSSGVGLTAAITKDAVTGDLALEGGALVLADEGICCIDEFDKMDEHDRTALHEVMEQQTVSIAKAGIVATLNARASVLAAANPLYGRYHPHKSLSENINLPNSLLSRFDLLFCLLDTANVDQDMALARHVTFVHQHCKSQYEHEQENEAANGENMDDNDDTNNDNNDDDDEIVSVELLRAYIAKARTYTPHVPPDVGPYIVEAYVGLRMSSDAKDQTAMTARQLLSILRLSQALARLRFSDSISKADVDEAIRLTHTSKASLTNADKPSKNNKSDVTSQIFTILKEYAMASSRLDDKLDLQVCEAMILRKGFTTQQLQTCLNEYSSLDIIQINQNKTHIHFL